MRIKISILAQKTSQVHLHHQAIPAPHQVMRVCQLCLFPKPHASVPAKGMRNGLLLSAWMHVQEWMQSTLCPHHRDTVRSPECGAVNVGRFFSEGQESPSLRCPQLFNDPLQISF